METGTDIIFEVLGICLVILILIILLVKYIMNVYVPFIDDRDFIRMEIARTHGNERVHWQHELRRLYMEQIPFIGKYLADFSRRKGRKQRERL